MDWYAAGAIGPLVRFDLAKVACSLHGCGDRWWSVRTMRDRGSSSRSGENLVLGLLPRPATAELFCVITFLKALPWRSSRLLSATFGGNPRSVDRMTAALWCHFPLGGVIHGGTHGLGEQRTTSLVKWYFILYMDGADLGGVALWRFGVRRAEMNSRTEVVLSGVVVASTAVRSDKVDAVVQH